MYANLFVQVGDHDKPHTPAPEKSRKLFEVIENEEGLKTAREVPNWRQDYFKS